MKARDVMTAKVISVSPETPVREIAKILLDKGISAVPIIDGTGAPLGMVSEGDLIGRADLEREARRDWWLALLAEGSELNAKFLAQLSPEHVARDVMSAPVITIGEDTDVSEIAKLLAAYRIKRVPVVRDGRITGIVSRADLLRALAAVVEAPPQNAAKEGLLAGALASLEEHFVRHHGADAARMAPPPSAAQDTGVTVEDFRHLVSDFEHKEVLDREAARRAAAEQRRRAVAELIDDHVSSDGWRTLLHEAREAAEHGQKEFLLLRFPSQLCSDGGRAINVEEANWPATLRGEAAELYLRWERELKPHGFRLAARVLDFPGGMPGDVGPFLLWGQ
jgi:CBS domain-containing protein